MISGTMYQQVLAVAAFTHSSSLSHRHGIPLVSYAIRGSGFLAKDLAAAWRHGGTTLLSSSTTRTFASGRHGKAIYRRRYDHLFLFPASEA
jgi:hypothetical protein